MLFIALCEFFGFFFVDECTVYISRTFLRSAIKSIIVLSLYQIILLLPLLSSKSDFEKSRKTFKKMFRFSEIPAKGHLKCPLKIPANYMKRATSAPPGVPHGRNES